MNEFSMNTITSYVYTYTLTFVVCFLGCFVKDLYDTVKKNTRINIIKIFISAIFVSITICAVNEYIEMKFPVYIFISFFSGLWGFVILENAFNLKLVLIVVKNIFKRISNPITKGVSDSIEEINKEKDKLADKKNIDNKE